MHAKSVLVFLFVSLFFITKMYFNWLSIYTALNEGMEAASGRNLPQFWLAKHTEKHTIHPQVHPNLSFKLGCACGCVAFFSLYLFSMYNLDCILL